MLSKKSALLTITALVALGASPAMATVTTYSNQAAFLAADPTATTVTFNGVAAAGTIYSMPAVKGASTYQGLTFSTPGYTYSSLNTIESKTEFHHQADGTAYGEDYFRQSSANFPLLLTLSGAENYIGFKIGSDSGDYSSLQAVDGSVTVNGTVYYVHSANYQLGYFGIYSTTAFTSVTISATDLSLDQISYGTTGITGTGLNDVAVPEPGTFAVMGLAFLAMVGMLGFARKREILANA